MRTTLRAAPAAIAASSMITALGSVSLALVLAGCTGESAAPPAGRARNVLVVTLDTLRADHLSTYGYRRPTSPDLDRLAARGTRFAAAFSAAPCTAASHASIFTGLPASFHSVGPYNSVFLLDGGAVTLAERLAAGGWSTAAVVSNPVLARRLGLDQGFATYDDDLQGRELNRPDVAEQQAAAAVEKARKILDGLAEPWFLWLHLQDPHGPYAPPPGWERFDGGEGAEHEGEGGEAAGEPAVLALGDDASGHGAIPPYQQLGDERRPARYVARYDDEIAYATTELGRWLDELAAAGRLDDTLVAVTADHGEALGEDGFYFAHGHSVGLDQVRVPLVLAGPGVPAGRVVAAPVTNAALFNTVLAALGLPVRRGDEAPSLLDLFAEGGAEPAAPPVIPPPVFVESVNQVGVAVGGAFLRRDRVPADDERFWSSPNPTTGGFWKPLGRELSPLAEVAPAAAASPETGADLDRLLDDFVRRARAADERMKPLRRRRQLSDGERDALRALGYAG